MTQLRVCVVGTGRAGMVHAENFRWRVPRAELVAVVDSDAARASEAAASLDLPHAGFTDLAAALAAGPIDAVVITTPTFTHRDLAVEAARAGVHVFCEKPMALTLAECDDIVAACESARVNLQVGFMRRFDPPFVTAKRDLDAGVVGRPVLVRSLTRGPGLPPAWANDVRRSNGMLAEVNSHDFDTVRWLGASDIVEVHAVAAALKRPDMRDSLPDFYDTAVVTAVLANGAFGVIDGVCPADYGYDARAEVVGSAGVLLVGELRDSASLRYTREGGGVSGHYVSWRERFKQAYELEAAEFVDSVHQGRPPRVGGLDGRVAVAAVLAARDSLALKRSVKVEY